MRIAVFLAAGLAVLTGVVRAQSSGDDDEMDYFPLVPTGNSLRFGLRYVGGPKISFGHLGNVPVLSTVNVGDTTTVASRTYIDGDVGIDARTSVDGNPIHDGLTNTWDYQESSQVTPAGDVAFHSYTASSLGAGFKGKTASAAGWELQVGHRLGRFGRKADLSLVAGFSFSDLNAKVGGSVPAQLNILTDVYSLNGQTPPDAPYTGPQSSSQNLFDVNGNPRLYSDGSQQTRSIDTTTLLADLPTRTATTGTTDVKGRWQIKGAYYTVRVGPLLQIPVTERLKLSFGAGAALAYVGSRYVVDETLTIDDTLAPIETTEEKEHQVILPAFYADADAEYWVTERAGFYLGASYQKSGSFDQTLNDRTAKIDLSTTYGVQSGITLRF